MRLLVCIFSLACVAPLCAARHPSGPTRFEATANSVEGITAKGTHAREGIVAADPTILPLGSRIRVSGAGAYSGVYVVTDTGRRVRGRHIDVYLLNNAEAKRFGRKTVSVRVLSRGDNKKDGS